MEVSVPEMKIGILSVRQTAEVIWKTMESSSIGRKESLLADRGEIQHVNRGPFHHGGKTMFRRMIFKVSILSLAGLLGACASQEKQAMQFTGAKNEVHLITLDPGHFHAALVQKSMYEQIDPVVHVYAPEGTDVKLHLERIDQYNNRADNPTQWEEAVYLGPDYLDKMLRDKAGNVVMLAGNNQKKLDYIKESIDAGLNVLADKPMVIDPAGFEVLKDVFQTAKKKGVLLYDVMTERHEITTMMQKALSQSPPVFGTLQEGSPEEPAVTKESVHHFFKYVSGVALQRPAWYYDVKQQGEGIVDVTTHLVDLVQWECFPNQALDYQRDIQMVSARRWATPITLEEFSRSTGESTFPDFLKPAVDNQGVLQVYANGEMVYRIKGVYAKVSVVWRYQAPEGGGDTHFSIMRGTRSNLVIRQGKEQNYQPELYVEPVSGTNRGSFENDLRQTIDGLAETYPGLAIESTAAGWHVIIPAKYRVGHEAHFAQVTQDYLQYLVDGKMPDWEVPDMLAKYYTTTTALKLAKQGTQ